MKRAISTLTLVAAAFAGGAITSHLAHARTSSESPYSLLEQLAKALVIVENEYVDPVERERLVSGAIKGMVGELDPHSAYFTPEENAIFRGETEGKFGGVGVEVESKGERIIVISPIEGGPAERAGILIGDRIVAVDGEPTRGQSIDKLVRKMRGAPGSKVEVTVDRPGEDKLKTFTLVREEIKVKSVTSKRLAGDVAYLRIKQFQGATHDELLSHIAKLKREGGEPQAVLLDLRNNPGGLVDQAMGVADEFLDAGTIYTTRHRGKVIDEEKASGGGALVDVPMVVLVNEYSASASELLAAAMQDHKRATIVGATTFGKGSVQTILNLPGGAGMKVTTMRYFTPKGRSIQAEGVVPDVAVVQKRAADEQVPLIKERDLENHLPAIDGAGRSPASAPTSPKVIEVPALPAGAALPRMDFGVLREVPEDPSASPDSALRIGYGLALEARARGKLASGGAACFESGAGRREPGS